MKNPNQIKKLETVLKISPNSSFEEFRKKARSYVGKHQDDSRGSSEMQTVHVINDILTNTKGQNDLLSQPWKNVVKDILNTKDTSSPTSGFDNPFSDFFRQSNYYNPNDPKLLKARTFREAKYTLENLVTSYREKALSLKNQNEIAVIRRRRTEQDNAVKYGKAFKALDRMSHSLLDKISSKRDRHEETLHNYQEVKDFYQIFSTFVTTYFDPLKDNLNAVNKSLHNNLTAKQTIRYYFGDQFRTTDLLIHNTKKTDDLIEHLNNSIAKGFKSIFLQKEIKL